MNCRFYDLGHCARRPIAVHARREPGRFHSGTCILIVEDSPVVGPFTADLLAELGYEVVGPAPNMAAARELIDEGKVRRGA